MAENRKILEHYKLELVVKSPVFIGDGNKLNKKEYIRKGNNIQIPDKKKMYHTLIQKKLVDRYEQYMLNPGERADLGEWLSKQRVSPAEYNKWISYSLNCDMQAAGRGQIDMMTFIKDAYGNPYVPGSSIKGALRTILISYLLMEYPDQYRDLRDTVYREADSQFRDGRVKRTKYLAAQAKDVEVQTLNTLKRKDEKPKDVNDAVNDMMSCLIISDSKPLSPKDLIMCQKIDMNQAGLEKPLNLSRECLRPGTKIEFDMTINLRTGYPEEKQFQFTAETINEAIKTFATQYLRSFFLPFKKLNKIDGNIFVNTLWLGGGVGYVSKTITYPMFAKSDAANKEKKGLETVSKIMQKTVNDVRHHHENDEMKGVSPHMVKCTKFNGTLYEFGRCAVKITDS